MVPLLNCFVLDNRKHPSASSQWNVPLCVPMLGPVIARAPALRLSCVLRFQATNNLGCVTDLRARYIQRERTCLRDPLATTLACNLLAWKQADTTFQFFSSRLRQWRVAAQHQTLKLSPYTRREPIPGRIFTCGHDPYSDGTRTKVAAHCVHPAALMQLGTSWVHLGWSRQAEP
jgi:hypothetical protein